MNYGIPGKRERRLNAAARKTKGKLSVAYLVSDSALSLLEFSSIPVEKQTKKRERVALVVHADQRDRFSCIELVPIGPAERKLNRAAR